MATNEAYSLTASLERAATTPTLLFFENSDGVQEKRQVRDNQVWDLEVVVTSCTRASKQGSASGATPDSENRQAFARVGKIHPYLRLPLQTSCMQQDRSAHLLLYNPMAEQQPSGAVSAAFPAPPPFYKHFTEQNLAHLKELQNSPPSSDPRTTDPSDDSNKAPSTDAHRLLDLPPELRYLIPPPPPPTGEYRSFGDHYNITAPLPTLLSQNIPQLYPSPSTPLHLLHLTRSILLNFLEYVHILATNPSDYGAKWDDLRDLFLNAHYLINEYRPHQARESLILLMEEQVRRGREEVRGVREARERVEGVLMGLGEVGREGVEVGEGEEEGRVKGVEAGRREREKREEWVVWDVINRTVP